MDINEDDTFEELSDEVEVIYLDNLDEYDDSEEIVQDEELQEVTDLAKLTFRKHNSSVFCGALSKNGLIAVTGGEDDMAYVWSTETLEVLLECTGHKDSVTEVGFNFNDQYVATGDMGGLIQVWNLEDNKLLWCYEGNDMEWLTWHNMTNVLISGSTLGDISVWQIPQGNCKILTKYGVSTTCGKLLPDGKRLLAGYADGQLRLWDIKSSSVLWSLAENISQRSITSLDITNNFNLCVIAPSAQAFKITDGKQIESFLKTTEKETEVVAFNNDGGLLATGALSGKFYVWDIKKKSIRHEATLGSPITVLKWSTPEKLIVGATDGCVYVCDAKSGTLIETLTGHNADILSMSLTTDNSMILTTSDDATAKLFAFKTE